LLQLQVTNYSQQDSTFLEFISTDDLHVSGGSSAHHQEHITVHTAAGIANQYCCLAIVDKYHLIHGSS
jgi:hypothetical protein